MDWTKNNQNQGLIWLEPSPNLGYRMKQMEGMEMSEHHFPVYPPEYSRMKPEFSARNIVRVYRSSPDRVTLQIRSEKHFMTASLPFDVACDIASALKIESFGAE